MMRAWYLCRYLSLRRPFQITLSPALGDPSGLGIYVEMLKKKLVKGSLAPTPSLDTLLCTFAGQEIRLYQNV